MDLTIIPTYRCNSKCSMCHVWQHPTLPREEITLDTLEKLPSNIDNCNISGGEPTLRDDLMDMVDLMVPKSRIMEISTNGLYAEKIVPIVKKYPNIKIRFSLDGFHETNNNVRGEKDGFNKKLNGMKLLIEAGGKDLGFGMTIQDDNVKQLEGIWNLCREIGVDFATSTLHNGFQFHKSDNYFWSRIKVAKGIEKLIEQQLKSWKVKHWFRGYLNLGLIEKILGHDRLISCTAGEEFVFIDPWSDVWACNVRNDLLLGNIQDQNWEEIWMGETVKRIRENVSVCKQNCWMVTTARTAMRNTRISQLPKMTVFKWVLLNKLMVSFRKSINFEAYIDYNKVYSDENTGNREKFLHRSVKKRITRKSEPHYQFGQFYNR